MPRWLSLGLAAFVVMRIARVQRTPAKGGFADIAPTSSASAIAIAPRGARGSAVKWRG